MARSVVLIVRKRGGRFLRRDESDGRLYEVGDEKAEAKTSQALREGLDVRATKTAANTLMGTDGSKKKRQRASEATADKAETVTCAAVEEEADKTAALEEKFLPAELTSSPPENDYRVRPPPRYPEPRGPSVHGAPLRTQGQCAPPPPPPYNYYPPPHGYEDPYYRGSHVYPPYEHSPLPPPPSSHHINYSPSYQCPSPHPSAPTTTTSGVYHHHRPYAYPYHTRSTTTDAFTEFDAFSPPRSSMVKRLGQPPPPLTPVHSKVNL